ncbi:isochorismatase family protein [Oryzibacter oryziterrae]|uniref:isochorismatase family protein n=1 Tax=Oryzibacter oryziterrae TaxID=2766474 RepID=UPI001F19AB86|nr:isochorismatase family protein [Oryzibacter oryziterrae]
MTAQTLIQMSGETVLPAKLATTPLVLIDYQNEYVDGPLKLVDVEAAAAEGRRLLAAARAAGAKIIHVAHKGDAGGSFDRAAWRGDFIEGLGPLPGEAVVEKPNPNAFAHTDLIEHLKDAKEVIIAGFMTHNCVASTARAALDLGLFPTVVPAACTTRDLPLPGGGVISAKALHDAELAGLADMHAVLATVDEVAG